MTVHGNVLMIGPSRAGKSFLTEVFRAKGLNAVDAQYEPGLLGWFNDDDSQPVIVKPNPPTKEWLQTHHFLMDRSAMAAFLAAHPDSIIFAHSWNIMECLDLFDEVYFMALSPEELERRMKLKRADHTWQGSAAEVDFMKARHEQRWRETKERGIPALDVSRSGDEIYDAFMALHARQAGHPG